MSEAHEFADSLPGYDFCPTDMDAARKLVRRHMLPGESETIVDNVAWAMCHTRTRYAEDLLPTQREVFQRVRVKRDHRRITGFYAKAGAIGYIVGEPMMGLDRMVLFERSSAWLVSSDHVRQCALSVDIHDLEQIPKDA